MKLIYLLAFLFSIFYFLFSGVGLAAGTGLYIEAPSSEIGLNSDFEVKILIDSDQPINAYSLNVFYPADFLEFRGFNNAGSIIDISREGPKVFQNGKIKIEGASLHPFLGLKGLILTLKFKAFKSSEVEIGFSDARVYLANGKGTKAIPKLQNRKIEILSEEISPTDSGVIHGVDEVLPRIEKISLIADPISPEQKLLGYLVNDNESGVKEVLVQMRRWLWWEKEAVSQNPTALAKNIWSVKLKVIDNSGNISEQVVYDWWAFVKFTLPILALFAFFVVMVINIIFRRKKSYN